MIEKNINLTPHSVEAEQAVLGGLILDNNQWENVRNIIDKNDFYNKKNQIIYEIMERLINKNEPVDIITLLTILEKENILKQTNIKKYLNDLAKHTPSAKNITIYSKIIKDQTILRSLIKVSKYIIELSQNNENKDVIDLIDIAEEKILSISNKHNKQNEEKLINISKTLTDTINKIELLHQLKSSITGVPSGFKELDNITSGLHPSELIVIAGRPSMGKTAMALNIAEHITIKTNMPVLIFSMEMPSDQITTRLLSSLSRVELQRLRNGMLKDTDWPRLSSAVSLISGKELFIDDSGSLTPFDVKTRARKIYKKHKKIGAIIIDYLQLMRMPGSYDNKVNEISEISRALKILAKELNVPIIALSQLNRSVEQRIDKRPMMSDLRESGAIEQDADLIIFIYRDEIYNKNSNDIGIAEIIIAKQRNGPIGSFKLSFLGQYSKFENLTN